MIQRSKRFGPWSISRPRIRSWNEKAPYDEPQGGRYNPKISSAAMESLWDFMGIILLFLEVLLVSCSRNHQEPRRSKSWPVKTDAFGSCGPKNAAEAAGWRGPRSWWRWGQRQIWGINKKNHRLNMESDEKPLGIIWVFKKSRNHQDEMGDNRNSARARIRWLKVTNFVAPFGSSWFKNLWMVAFR